MKKVIKYDPYFGISIPDGAVSARAAQFVYSDKTYICVSNFEFLNEVRLKSLNGECNRDDLIFMFYGFSMKLDKEANYDKWPKSFGDFTVNRAIGIIQARGNSHNI